MRVRVIILMLGAVTAAGVARAGPNDMATFPLHATETFGDCAIGDPCDPGPLVIEVSTGAIGDRTVYLLVRNHTNVVRVQTAFEWDPALVLNFGQWDCQGLDQVNTRTPTASGANAGTLTTDFDAIVGPTTAVIGFLQFFSPVAAGCVRQTQSSFPNGTHVVAGDLSIDSVNQQNLGSICAGSSMGIDTCDFTPDPVETRTWGRIKKQYTR